jgi:hypothetical protein
VLLNTQYASNHCGTSFLSLRVHLPTNHLPPWHPAAAVGHTRHPRPDCRPPGQPAGQRSGDAGDGRQRQQLLHRRCAAAAASEPGAGARPGGLAREDCRQRARHEAGGRPGRPAAHDVHSRCATRSVGVGGEPGSCRAGCHIQLKLKRNPAIPPVQRWWETTAWTSRATRRRTGCSGTWTPLSVVRS